MNQLNLPHGTNTTPHKKLKSGKTEKLKSKKRICSEVTVNSLGNPCSQSCRRKEGYGGKDLQKRKVLKSGMKE